MNLELKMSTEEQTKIAEQPKKRVYKKKAVEDAVTEAERIDIDQVKNQKDKQNPRQLQRKNP